MSISAKTRTIETRIPPGLDTFVMARETTRALVTRDAYSFARETTRAPVTRDASVMARETTVAP